MNKLTISILTAALASPVAASNLSMKINGVKPVDVTPGTEFHSMSIDRPELFPTICPDERIVIDANLPLADMALGVILGIEDDGSRFSELEYKMKDDGQCHVWKFAKEDPLQGWSIHNLFLQPHLWSVTGTDSITGVGRLVAIGCPTSWTIDYRLYWQWETNWGEVSVSEAPMVNRLGDWCDSGEYKFRVPPDGSGRWRIVLKRIDGTEVYTDWVTLVPTP